MMGVGVFSASSLPSFTLPNAILDNSANKVCFALKRFSKDVGVFSSSSTLLWRFFSSFFLSYFSFLLSFFSLFFSTMADLGASSTRSSFSSYDFASF